MIVELWRGCDYLKTGGKNVFFVWVCVRSVAVTCTHTPTLKDMILVDVCVCGCVGNVALTNTHITYCSC